jgi:hypothetical protein
VSDSLRHPWVVVSILSAALAAWMGLGTLHEFQHADSLLTVLVSTQKWTPFFWGQDRFGMLVPLLAMPIRHPLANMLAQGWIMTVAALLAPFVLARFVTERTGTWIAAGGCTNTLFLLVATPAVQFDWFVTQPYALSISLGFAGLVVASREHPGWTRNAAAFVLLLLACWVNIGSVVMLAIGALLKESRAVRLLALQAAAAALASLAARYLASGHTITALAPAGKWPNGWWQLLAGTLGVTAHAAMAIGVAVGTLAALAWLWKTDALPPRRTAAALLAMGVGTWLVLGTSLWVGMNLYSFRYMYPALMVAGTGVAIVFSALLARWTEVLSIASLCVMTGTSVVSYGAPSIDRIDRGLDDRFGRQSATILHAGATVIAGDYWRVWPAVFHANLSLTRSRTRAQVFGLTFRSEETDALWQIGDHQARIAGWPDDRSIGGVAAEHGVTLTPLGHEGEIDLYTGRW